MFTLRLRLLGSSPTPYSRACLARRLSTSAPVMTGTCIGTRMNTTDQNSASANGPLCRASRLRAKRHGARDAARARGCDPFGAVEALAPGAPARPDSRGSGARLEAISTGSGCAHEGLGAASFMVQEGPDLGRKFLASARRRYHGDVRVVLKVLAHRQR